MWFLRYLSQCVYLYILRYLVHNWTSSYLRTNNSKGDQVKQVWVSLEGTLISQGYPLQWKSSSYKWFHSLFHELWLCFKSNNKTIWSKQWSFHFVNLSILYIYYKCLSILPMYSADKWITRCSYENDSEWFLSEAQTWQKACAFCSIPPWYHPGGWVSSQYWLVSIGNYPEDPDKSYVSLITKLGQHRVTSILLPSRVKGRRYRIHPLMAKWQYARNSSRTRSFIEIFWKV